jgi:hypothetical protein
MRLPVLPYRSLPIHSRLYRPLSVIHTTMGASISTMNGQSAIKKIPLELWLRIIELVFPLSLPDWRGLATIESLRWTYDMDDRDLLHGPRHIGFLRLVNRAAAQYLHPFQYVAVSLHLYHRLAPDEVLRQGSLPRFERAIQGHQMARNTQVMRIRAQYPFDLGALGARCPHLTHLHLDRFHEFSTAVLPSVLFLEIEAIDWDRLKSISIVFPNLLFLSVTAGFVYPYTDTEKSITFNKLRYLEVEGQMFDTIDMSRLHIKEVRGFKAEPRWDGIALASAFGSQFQVLQVCGYTWENKHNFIALDILLQLCPNISTLITVLGYWYDPPKYEDIDAIYPRVETLIYTGKDRVYIEPWNHTYWSKRRFPNVRKMIVEVLPDDFYEHFCTWVRSEFGGVTVERREAGGQVHPLFYRES